jgi:GH15 family glucan-1,4-alpha-glucosidase
LDQASNKLKGLNTIDRVAIQKSLLIIKAHCDERGSILASGDSSIFNYDRDYYCYCWPRDAAYATWPLMRVGIFDEARKFFDFAKDTMHRDGYLMHKYQPDRAIGSTWHPLIHGRTKELAIQEDETAIVIYMIGEYFRLSQDSDYIKNIYDNFISPCANFMSNFIDESTNLPHASYDLWEQKFLTSVYTVSTVIAGLETAASLAKSIGKSQSDVQFWQSSADRIRRSLDLLYHPDGYFRKGYLLQADGSLAYDDAIDISNLYGPYMFAKLPLNDPRLISSFNFIQKHLLNTSPIGGVIRYEHDGYFLSKSQYEGNPWVVCSLWLAQIYNSYGQTDKATELIKWSQKRAFPSGAISEQFDPENGFSLSVTPLIWSHAELANTILDINNIN